MQFLLERKGFGLGRHRGRSGGSCRSVIRHNLHANEELGEREAETVALLGLGVVALAVMTALVVGAVSALGLNTVQDSAIPVRAVTMPVVAGSADHDPSVTTGAIEDPVAVGLPRHRTPRGWTTAAVSA